MDELIFNILFWGVFVGGGSIFIIFCAVKAIRQHKEYKEMRLSQKENQADYDDENFEPVCTINKFKATVIEQFCSAKMIGIKYPKAIREFTVVFKVDNGEIIKINVPEETYEGFDEGQTGILTLVDGELYSFELEKSEN